MEIELTAYLWARTLEQLLLVILIIGRWLLPKGNLTRDQLSQLLLVYIGMAADIIELFEAFKEDQVVEHLELTYIILGMWTGSLLQFTLVLTATKARKMRGGAESSLDDDYEAAARNRQIDPSCCCDLDIWAIMTSLVLQDGPFLCLRLLLIFHYHIFSYMNIFFSCKNTLLVLLQFYRLFVVIGKKISRRRKTSYEPNQHDHHRSECSIIGSEQNSHKRSNLTLDPEYLKQISDNFVMADRSKPVKSLSWDPMINEKCPSGDDKRRSKSDVNPPSMSRLGD